MQILVLWYQKVNLNNYSYLLNILFYLDYSCFRNYLYPDYNLYR